MARLSSALTVMLIRPATSVAMLASLTVVLVACTSHILRYAVSTRWRDRFELAAIG
ncbi:hypothetical protein [Candidatus Entotheonella palauensis]|uniref:Uncharacterized protein n=1 Tax=Candidatus Entotheonella gemina TaxID=1429439 RepID=W4MDB3_9BACT|nr:hypothetical protein [Candidatus Entotheonella palauensis]ETX08304.1 MAG: hypothetical protein ETSY2_06180 [Candidatus Entotheonella gemina]